MRCGDPEHLTWEAERVAPDDARRCAHGKHDLRRSAVRNIERYLGARVPCADHEHAPPDVSRRISVVRRMHDLACESPRPVGKIGLLAVAGRDHDAFGVDRSFGRYHFPAGEITVNTSGLDARPHNERRTVRVAL